MSEFTPALKHHILQQYLPHSSDNSFAALAKRYDKYIQDILAQACGALDRYPLYLVLDRSSIHNEEKILEAFHDNGCQELVEMWKMPPEAGKRMSPLNNALFHHWKERISNGEQITNMNVVTRMADCNKDHN